MEHKLVNGIEAPMSEEETAQRVKDELLWVEQKKLNYRTERAHAYPKIGDQLDAILKQFNGMVTDLDVELQEIIEAWEAVKIKYPKPEAN